MLRWPADEWQAWAWREATDMGGDVGMQRLQAIKIAQDASSKDNMKDPRDIAPYLWEGHREAKRREREKLLPPGMHGKPEAEQKAYLARRTGSTVH